MEKLIIKKATGEDVNALQQISKSTFIEAFAAYNTQENMNQYLSQNLSIEQLSKELNNPFSSFYIASINKQVIGYLKLNFAGAQTEENNPQSVEIERIYILKEFYGKGFAQEIYNKCIEVAKQTNKNLVWLGVWEHNLRAIAFYKKLGLQQFSTHTFMLGTDEQTDVLMKINI